MSLGTNITWVRILNDKSIKSIQEPICEMYIEKKDFDIAYHQFLITLDGRDLTSYVDFFWRRSPVDTAFADFYALMPPDNAATVAPGTDVSFPQDGPNSGSITRTSASSFDLPTIGTYEVNFQVSVNEAGQLILTLDGVDLAYTVVGRATGTSQIVGLALVTTTSVNSILTVRNPAGNTPALTITPRAGGTRPVSAHLVIKLIHTT